MAENKLPGVLVFAGFDPISVEWMLRREDRQTDKYVLYRGGVFYKRYHFAANAYARLTKQRVPWGQGPTLESSMGG